MVKHALVIAMKSIANLESTIRDLINHPRKRYSLSKDPAQWYKLCSSMDVIGDTELAINAFLTNIKKTNDTDGELYIILYGVLQILFVQQDAVKHLTEALELNYIPNKTLEIIRNIRNDSIGHPTKRGVGKGYAFNFITRMSMTRCGFTLITRHADRGSTLEQVNICHLIDEQRNELRQTLNKVIKHLNREAMKHKNQYKNETLADIFHPSLQYYYEKIEDAIFGNVQKELGIGTLKLVAKIINEFKDSLEKRQIIEAYDLKDNFIWTEYSLKKVLQFLEDPSKDNLNEKDAYIYFSFICKKVAELNEIAKEIDEEYQSKVRKK
jgi:hypothetical protein